MNKIYNDFIMALCSTLILITSGFCMLYMSTFNILGSFKTVFNTMGSVAIAFSIFGVFVCIYIYPTKKER